MDDFIPNLGHGLVDANSDTVMKEVTFEEGLSSAEVLTIVCVQQQTTIPVPAIRRSLQNLLPDDESANDVFTSGFIAMDYIRGSTLRAAWPALSLWSKLRVVWTLRQYIRQLRSITSPFSNRPGPIGGPSALPPLGLVFYDRIPSFETVDDLAQYYNNFRNECQAIGELPSDFPPFPDASPLVMTHGDLHQSNIMLDKSGRVWLIDWGTSGYLPVWYEYIAAAAHATAKNAPTSWLALLPLVTSPYFAHEAYAEQIQIISRPSRRTPFTGLYPIWEHLKSWVASLGT